MIARGIFTSTTDLARKLMLYIRAYNKLSAVPVELLPPKAWEMRTSLAGH